MTPRFSPSSPHNNGGGGGGGGGPDLMVASNLQAESEVASRTPRHAAADRGESEGGKEYFSNRNELPVLNGFRCLEFKCSQKAF